MIMTGIGSRDITSDERKSIITFATLCASNGINLRSGKASGSDESFQLGYECVPGSRCEIYTPWSKFNNPNVSSVFDIDSSSLSTWSEAQRIAKRIHPAPHKLSRAALALHTRNVHQVLGEFLIEPSDFCVFCADEDNMGRVKGGTATAVNLCKELAIPIYNIRTDKGDQYVRELWWSSVSGDAEHFSRLVNGWESNTPR